MVRQMFTALSLASLLLSVAGCAVVGYPAPVGAPVTVSANRPRTHSPEAREETATRTYEVFGRSYTTLPTSRGYREVGVASWYGEPFHGRPTASGEKFDMYGLTAAHRTLPLPTCVEVRRMDDDRTVTVRVNDRGPFSSDTRRIVDLSFSAAQALGLIGTGTAEVEVRALDGWAEC